MHDRDVRAALHRKVLKEHHGESDTLVLDELGIRHGAARVDVAVVNGELHGFEIKSDSDTLTRLAGQVSLYNEVFDRVTLVVGCRHLTKAEQAIPDWWGTRVVTEGSRGGIYFEETRKAKTNPAINPIALAELLWRNEVVEELVELGERGAILRKPRAVLYQHLATVMELEDLRDTVRRRLKVRAGWRGQSAPLLCVG